MQARSLAKTVDCARSLPAAGLPDAQQIELNSPLAGHTLTYQASIRRHAVHTAAEKTLAVVQRASGSNV